MFNSAAAFDKHRVGNYDMNEPHFGRRCLDEDEMTRKGMAVSDAGFWVTELMRKDLYETGQH